MVKRGLRTLTDVFSAWGIIWPMLPSGVTAVITAYLARINDVPWHLVIFFGTGVGFFVLGAFAALRYLAARSNIYGKLKFEKYRTTVLATSPDNDKLHVIGTAITIRNTSEVDLWVSLEEIIYSLEGKTQKEHKAPNKEPFLIQAVSHADLNLHTIENINASKPFSGSLIIKMKYGRNKAKLRRKIVFNASPQFNVTTKKSDGSLVALHSDLPINSIEYE
jgi:hypothetical protein